MTGRWRWELLSPFASHDLCGDHGDDEEGDDGALDTKHDTGVILGNPLGLCTVSLTAYFIS
jgi:hypothetical protein